MAVFHFVFTVGMLLLPAVFMLFYRSRADAAVEQVRVLTRRLWAWTGVSLGVYVGLVALRRAGALEAWIELPHWMTLGRYPDELAWLMFFPLWFCLAMRLLVAVRPEAASPFPQGGDGSVVRRSASLTSRTSPVRVRHWLLGWAIVGAATAVVIGQLAQGNVERPAITMLVLALSALPLILTPWAMGMTLREPEPMDAHGSEELLHAYASHRAAKVWGFFALALSMSTMCAGMAVVLALGADGGATAGWIGGSLGGIVGIAGAAFGVMMGNQRMRIRRLLDRLEASGE